MGGKEIVLGDHFLNREKKGKQTRWPLYKTAVDEVKDLWGKSVVSRRRKGDKSRRGTRNRREVRKRLESRSEKQCLCSKVSTGGQDETEGKDNQASEEGNLGGEGAVGKNGLATTLGSRQETKVRDIFRGALYLFNNEKREEERKKWNCTPGIAPDREKI